MIRLMANWWSWTTDHGCIGKKPSLTAASPREIKGALWRKKQPWPKYEAAIYDHVQGIGQKIDWAIISLAREGIIERSPGIF
jgi:hypothetical protein